MGELQTLILREGENALQTLIPREKEERARAPNPNREREREREREGERASALNPNPARERQETSERELQTLILRCFVSCDRRARRGFSSEKVQR